MIYLGKKNQYRAQKQHINVLLLTQGIAITSVFVCVRFMSKMTRGTVIIATISVLTAISVITHTSELAGSDKTKSQRKMKNNI